MRRVPYIHLVELSEAHESVTLVYLYIPESNAMCVY